MLFKWFRPIKSPIRKGLAAAWVELSEGLTNLAPIELDHFVIRPSRRFNGLISVWITMRSVNSKGVRHRCGHRGTCIAIGASFSCLAQLYQVRVGSGIVTENQLMKKLLLALGICVGALSGASGATYSLADMTPHVIAPGSPYSGSFVLANAGYDASTETIIGAVAGFALQDPNSFFGGREDVVVSLEGDFFASVVNFASATLGGAVNLTYLADGVLKFSITSAPGSVPSFLTLSALQWTTAPKTSRVPDGGSMMALLGLSILGLGCVGRRVHA